MNRIIILGATGSGKTTLAFQMAAKLGYPAIDLDDLYWRPDWIETPRDEFLRDVDKATAKANTAKCSTRKPSRTFKTTSA
ncbi:MAG TPA: hypothetical protein VIG74_06490 [Alphaproteobacteria bacterium]|jgi:adenylate kinase family enzyme